MSVEKKIHIAIFFEESFRTFLNVLLFRVNEDYNIAVNVSIHETIDTE